MSSTRASETGRFGRDPVPGEKVKNTDREPSPSGGNKEGGVPRCPIREHPRCSLLLVFLFLLFLGFLGFDLGFLGFDHLL